MKQKFWIKDFPQVTIIIFFIFNFFGMQFYAGGNMINSDQSGYDFSFNFFSDLGALYSHNGELNIISFCLFNSSLAFVGICFAILFYKIRNVFKDYKIISRVGSIFGIISGLLYLGVAFTPSDTPLNLFQDNMGDPWLHIFVATWAFRSIVITAIIYSVIIFKTKNFDNKYAYGFVVFGTFVLCYVIYTLPPNGDNVYFLLDARPPAGTNLSVTLESDKYLLNLQKHVLAQKAVVFWMLSSIYIYTLGLSNYLLKKELINN